MDIVFFSTHCPKCNILEKKLKAKNITYIENNDIDYMISLGLKNAPALKIGDEIKDFKASVDWINSLEVDDGNN